MSRPCHQQQPSLPLCRLAPKTSSRQSQHRACALCSCECHPGLASADHLLFSAACMLSQQAEPIVVRPQMQAVGSWNLYSASSLNASSFCCTGPNMHSGWTCTTANESSMARSAWLLLKHMAISFHLEPTTHTYVHALQHVQGTP